MAIRRRVSLLLSLLVSLCLGCISQAPDRALSPCESLVERARTGCREVAARCTSASSCMESLRFLGDPPGYFPSGEACDESILQRLSGMSPEDIPTLLRIIETRNPQAMDALEYALPQVSDSVVLALASHPSWMATAALGAIAQRSPHRTTTLTDARPEAGDKFLARADVSQATERVWPAWRLGYLSRTAEVATPREPLPRETLARQIENLEAENEWQKVCSLGWPASETAPLEVLETFARLAATARSPKARQCALEQTFSPSRGAGLAFDPYGGHAKRRAPERPCQSSLQISTDRWYFWKNGVRVVQERRSEWQPVIIPLESHHRRNHRGFRCVDGPPRPVSVSVKGGLLSECNGLCFEQDQKRFMVGGTLPLGLLNTPSGDAYAVGAHISGDDDLYQNLVVWRWDGEQQKLHEQAALPGESYRWSTLEEDGTLIVGTSNTWRQKEVRFVTAIKAGGEEALSCW
jgi:hypothetical protein